MKKMQPFVKRSFLAAVALAWLVTGARPAPGYTVSGSVSIYTDPFSSGTLAVGNTGAFNFSGDNGANLFDADVGSNSRATRIAGGSTTDVGFWQSTLGAAVPVEAVITFANYATTAATYDTILGSTTIQNNVPVTVNNGPFIVTDLSSPILASTARMEFTGVGTTGSDFFQSTASIYLQNTAGYAQLDRVAISGATASDVNNGFVAANTLDDNRNTSWVSLTTGESDRWIQYDFTKSVQLDTLIFDNQRNQIMDIQRWTGSSWATFGTVTGAATWAVLKVDPSVPETDRVRFLWASSAQTFGGIDSRIGDVVFFAGLSVPEPSMVLLLALGGLAVWGKGVRGKR